MQNEECLEIQLPSMDTEYPLSTEQVADFQRDGHVVFSGLASAEEIGAYRPVINRAADRFNAETRPIAERDTYGKAFLQIQNLWERDATVRRFVLARRFAKVAAQLMGVNDVRIYHDQALFKEPGGGPTPWHQDQYYWPLDTNNTVTLWMPLVDIPPEVGSMTFGTGSHRLGYLGEFEISDASQAMFDRIIEERGLKLTNYGALHAGDATYHYGWTLHGAPGNPTPHMREVMTIIYHAADARVTEPDHAHRVDDLRKWLPGLVPGDVAASSLNPLIPIR